jgi:hypothetical protein
MDSKNETSNNIKDNTNQIIYIKEENPLGYYIKIACCVALYLIGSICYIFAWSYISIPITQFFQTIIFRNEFDLLNNLPQAIILFAFAFCLLSAPMYFKQVLL